MHRACGMNRREFARATLAASTMLSATPSLRAYGAAGSDGRASESAMDGTHQPGSTATPRQDVPLAPPDKQPPDLRVPRKQSKARWAVVGLGRLAIDEVMPAFGEAERSTPT